VRDAALRDAARQYVAEQEGVDEAVVRMLEVQQRQGETVAFYFIEGQEFERHERLPQEVTDGE